MKQEDIALENIRDHLLDLIENRTYGYKTEACSINQIRLIAEHSDKVLQRVIITIEPD